VKQSTGYISPHPIMYEPVYFKLEYHSI